MGKLFTRALVPVRFHTERKLLAGKHKTSNTHRSILHFSLNKAATQYTKYLLKRCATASGITHVGLNEYAFHSDLPFLDRLDFQQMREYSHAFKPEGYLYSVFGGMVPGIPNLDAYQIVFMVRDPRDILVSSYYSLRKTHLLPSAGGNKYRFFMRRRSWAKESDIDEFVLAESERLKETVSGYAELLNAPNLRVHLTRYEDMTSNFESWLQSLLEACELKLDQRLFKKLVNEYHSMVPKEHNISSHVRRGRPGDFHNQLQTDTIEILTEYFRKELSQYGYVP